jgi:hypothetical protein
MAVVRARATFERRFLREEAVVHGEPRTHADGTIELRPVCVWSAGIDGDYLVRQLDRPAVLVEALALRGLCTSGGVMSPAEGRRFSSCCSPLACST